MNLLRMKSMFSLYLDLCAKEQPYQHFCVTEMETLFPEHELRWGPKG